MLQLRRLFYLGFSMLVAGAIGAMAGTTLSCGVSIFSDEPIFCGSIVYFWMLGIPISSVATFVIGLPIYAIFKYFEFDRCWQYASAGIIVAAAILCVSFASGATWPFSSWPSIIQSVSIPVLTALALWLLLAEQNTDSKGSA